MGFFINGIMLVFYGLGNNSEKYYRTKHNAGRIALENLVKIKGLSFSSGGYYFSCKDSEQNYYLYSAGFMNTSGQNLSQFMQYYKIKANLPNFKLIVLQDDSDQSVGKLKLTQAGGHAGHKGIADIYKQAVGFDLPSQNIWRLKIGIRPVNNKLRSETFVLKKINKQEEDYYQKLAHKINQNWNLFEDQKLEAIQNLLHG